MGLYYRVTIRRDANGSLVAAYSHVEAIVMYDELSRACHQYEYMQMHHATDPVFLRKGASEPSIVPPKSPCIRCKESVWRLTEFDLQILHYLGVALGRLTYFESVTYSVVLARKSTCPTSASRQYILDEYLD